MTITLQWRSVPIGDRGEQALTSASQAEIDTLRKWAVDANVLEVGTAYGFTAATLGLVAHSVLSVDPYIYGPGASPSSADSLALMKSVGVDERVALVIGHSQSVLPWLAQRRMSFELIFIDGAHDHATVWVDLRNAWALLSPGGVLAAHDYDETLCPDVRPTIDEFTREFKIEGSVVVDTLWLARRHA